MARNKLSKQLKTDKKLLTLIFLSAATFALFITTMVFLLINSKDLLAHIIIIWIFAGLTTLGLTSIMVLSIIARFSNADIPSEDIKERSILAYRLAIWLFFTPVPAIYAYQAYQNSGGKASTIKRATLRFQRNHVDEVLDTDEVKQLFENDKKIIKKIKRTNELYDEEFITLEEKNSFILDLLIESGIKVPEPDLENDSAAIAEVIEIIETY